MVRARLFFILIAPVAAFCQNVTPRICGGVLINHSDYEKFFARVSGLLASDVAEAARQALDLSSEQIQAVLTIQTDLATLSCAIDKAIRPLMFDARLQVAASGSVDPVLKQKIHALQAQWEQAVTDHVQQIRSVIGPERFKTLDAAVRSEKPSPGEPPRPARRY